MLDDVDAWNPFKGNPEGSPFQYPLYYEPGFDLNSTAPGNFWLPDPVFSPKMICCRAAYSSLPSLSFFSIKSASIRRWRAMAGIT